MATISSEPPPPPLTKEDIDHLNNLSIGFKIYACLAGCGGFLPLIHIFLGLTLATGGALSSTQNQNTAEGPLLGFVGIIFVFGGALVMALMFTLAYYCWQTSNWLTERKHHTGCIIVAAVACANFPFGTILGVLTLIVINRTQVKAAFDISKSDL